VSPILGSIVVTVADEGSLVVVVDIAVRYSDKVTSVGNVESSIIVVLAVSLVG
jgi:hypothetical protein